MGIIKKLESSPVEENITKAKVAVMEASSPKELVCSVITLAKLNEELKMAKKELKEKIDAPTKIIKRIETLAKELELDIKEKVKETYKDTSYTYKKVNDETGEVEFKEKKQNNLGKNMFIFTESKKKMVVDNKAITQEKYPHLFKQVWVLDSTALKNEPMENLPMVEKATEAKVGIQFASIKKTMLLEGDK